MGLPTLLRKGNLIEAPNKTEEDLKDVVPIDYIVNYLEDVDNDKMSNDKMNNSKMNNDMTGKVIILESKTGSGKSTVLPVKLYNKFKKKLLITQPRVITAIEIVKDIVARKENGLVLYQDIGYQTQEHVRKPQKKGILFSTLGILLQYLKHIDPSILCRMFKFLVVDEVHDSSTDRDLTLFYLKKLTNSVPKTSLPFIILMSATLDIKQLSDYFNTSSIFKVAGQSHKLDIIYQKPKLNYTQEIINIISNILKDKTQKEKNIIIFFSSMGTINKINLELIKKFKNDIITVPMDSKNYNKVGKDYINLMSNTNQPKVILTTNVAETGLTLPNLKYCIDTGYFINVSFEPVTDTYIIAPMPINKASAIQRAGRVGRQFPGICYRLFDKDTFEAMDESIIPEIYKTNLCRFILNTGLDLNLINPPAYNSIKNALNTLYILGFIKSKTNNSFKLTKIGKISKLLFKLNLEHLKIIISGFYFNVNILDLITIISIINTKFKSTYKYETDDLKIDCEFINNLIIIYKLLNTSDKIEKKKIYEVYKINKSNFKSVIKAKQQLIKELLLGLKLDIYNNKINLLEQLALNNTEYIQNIKHCLYEGFKLNILQKNQNDKYINRYGIKIMTPTTYQSSILLTNTISNNKADYISSIDFNIDSTFLIS